MKTRILFAAPLVLALLTPFKSHADDQMAIIQKASGKCVDLDANITPDPSQKDAQLWSCGGNPPYTTSSNQILKLRWVGRYGGGPWETYQLRSWAGYYCLDVKNYSQASGAQVVFAQCDDTSRSQMWMRAATNKDLTTTAKWINLNSGKCLDAPGTYDGVLLQQYDCASGSWWPQDFQAYYTVP